MRILVITVGMILTLLLTCPGTALVFMLGGQIVRNLNGTATTGPNDGELFWDGMLSLFAMPFVLIIGTAFTLWGAGCIKCKSHPPGYCDQCGYDLRGGRLGASCPECGDPNTITSQLRSERDIDRHRLITTHIVVWGFVYVLVVGFFGRMANPFASYPGPIDLILWGPPAFGVFWIMRMYHVNRGAKFKYFMSLSPIYLPLIFIGGAVVGHANSYNPLPFPNGFSEVLLVALPWALIAAAAMGLVLYLLHRSGIGKKYLLWQLGVIIALAVIASHTGYIHGQGY